MGKRHADLKSKINIDQIAESLGLPSWESINENNCDFLFDAGVAARGSFLEDNPDASEMDQEQAAADGEYAAEAELFRSWHDAVMAVAESLYGEHGLELHPVKFTRKVPEGTRPYEYRVVPKVSWLDAADHIRNTIEGDGFLGYYINGLRGFLSSGPYTARSAVLAHLHWIKKYPEVYGSKAAQRLYENAWRD